MTPLIRLGPTAELALTVAESTGRFQGILPLGGSHVSQIAIILGLVALVLDLIEAVGDVAQWLGRRKALTGSVRDGSVR